MFGKVYLPDHSFKLIYRFKFFLSFLDKNAGPNYLTECLR